MTQASLISCKWVSLLLLLAAHIPTLLAQQDGLLANGDFETATGNAGVPEWTTRGIVEVVKPNQKQGAMVIVVPHGLQAVRLSNDAEIEQEVKVEKGSLYSLTFNAARTCAMSESLKVSAPPATQTVDLQTVHSVRGWDSYSAAFTAEYETVAVALTNQGMEEDPACGPVIDNVAIKKLFTPEKTPGNALINGDFEEGPFLFRNDSLGVLLPTNFDAKASPLPAWVVESNRPVRFIDSEHFAVPQGKRAIELISGKEGSLSQMVETEPSKEYRLSFLVGHAGDNCRQPLAVRAFAADQAETVHYAPDANSTYQLAVINFTARAEQTRIGFFSVYYNVRNDDMTSLCGPVVDDVKVFVSGSASFGFGFGCSVFGLSLGLLLVLGFF